MTGELKIVSDCQRSDPEISIFCTVAEDYDEADMCIKVIFYETNNHNYSSTFCRVSELKQ